MTRRAPAALAAQRRVITDLTAQAGELTPAMQEAVGTIDALFGDAQAASLTAYWRIGETIANVGQSPDDYLTEAQRAAHIDPAALLISLFAGVYSPEQLRSAEAFYEKYPTQNELTRLIELRCPDRPRWRMTTSHVQLLTQIPDDEQRAATEVKCAEEALTAKNLATELQEMRGKRSRGGRGHQAPKGLKNKLHDLLQHLQRFVGRSRALWLGDDNVYDELVNTSPSKRDATVMQHFAAIAEQLVEMSDVIGDHIALANTASTALAAADAAEDNDAESADDEDIEDDVEVDAESDDDDDDDEEPDAEEAPDSPAAAAANAVRRAQRRRNITR